MKSRISIEVDFERKNLPIIQILKQDSEDVRDKLVSNFLQSLQHASRWCKIDYIGEGNEPTQARWHISPLTLEDLLEEVKLMQATIDHHMAVADPHN